MCRKLCCVFSSSLAVILSLLFSSPPFCNVTKKTGPPSLSCQYQCKAYKDSDELQLMVSSSPSWIIRDWGLCCNFWVWTPVQKRQRQESTKGSHKILAAVVGMANPLPLHLPNNSIIMSAYNMVYFVKYIGSERPPPQDRRDP